MTTESDPYNTKKKRVSWDQFNTLMNCFSNDPRLFIVTETDSEGVARDHQMSMDDLINFWDGGIACNQDRINMLSVLEAANSLQSRGQKKEVIGWTIKRIA